MTVNDRVDLIGPLRGLINALGIARDCALRACEPVEEKRDPGFSEAGCPRRRLNGWRYFERACQRGFKAGCMPGYKGRILPATLGEIGEQPGEERGVHARLDGEEKIRFFRCCRSPRIDHNDLCSPFALITQHPLKQDWVA